VLAAAVEPSQSLSEEHIFPELAAVFEQQQYETPDKMILELQFQPERVLSAQEPNDRHDASIFTSQRSAVAREERRIASLPPHTEARRLSTFGLRVAFGGTAAPRRAGHGRRGCPCACVSGG
jgi:hypothetical protein